MYVLKITEIAVTSTEDYDLDRKYNIYYFLSRINKLNKGHQIDHHKRVAVFIDVL